MQSKRAIFAAIAFLAVVALGLTPRPAVSQEEPPTAFTRRAILGAIARDGRPLVVGLSAASAYQGGTFLVEASEGVAGTVTLFGRESVLVPNGEGLVGFVGVGTEDPPGGALLRIEVWSAAGGRTVVERPVTVLVTDWTVAYIDLPPGVGELLDPALVQAEAERLTTIYAGISSREWDGAWLSPVTAFISGYFGEQRSFNGGPVGGHHGEPRERSLLFCSRRQEPKSA